jgi:hypothetical protein
MLSSDRFVAIFRVEKGRGVEEVDRVGHYLPEEAQAGDIDSRSFLGKNSTLDPEHVSLVREDHGLPFETTPKPRKEPVHSGEEGYFQWSSSSSSRNVKFEGKGAAVVVPGVSCELRVACESVSEVKSKVVVSTSFSSFHFFLFLWLDLTFFKRVV